MSALPPPSLHGDFEWMDDYSLERGKEVAIVCKPVAKKKYDRRTDETVELPGEWTCRNGE